MKWTNDDRKALLALKSEVDSDNIKIKELIKNKLVDNRFIIHVLNNLELEKADAEPDDYYNVNILPYYMLPETQHETMNYLCFEVSYTELERYNSSAKLLQIIFHVLCHHSDIIEEDTGIARHDLLAALVQDQFNFSNIFGAKIELISDKPSTTDSLYATRTLVFQQITDNNLIKTRNNTSRFANKTEMSQYGKN